jgi:FkbM family methyltransferase
MQQIDPVLLALAQKYVQPKAVVWDIGANVGLFTFSAAHCAGSGGQVFSFEPDSWLVQLLRKSAAIQPRTSAPVTIIPAAIAEDVSLKTFNIAVRTRSTNFLEGYGGSQTGGVAEKQTVLALSLDWLSQQIPHPDVIKIDVEGAEMQVLKGSLKFFQHKRPILLMEVDGPNTHKVAQFLQTQNYTLYDGEQDIHNQKPLGHAPWCTVAFPNE